MQIIVEALRVSDRLISWILDSTKVDQSNDEVSLWVRRERVVRKGASTSS